MLPRIIAGTRTSSPPGFPGTFLSTWDFLCSNRETPGQTGMSWSPYQQLLLGSVPHSGQLQLNPPSQFPDGETKSIRVSYSCCDKGAQTWGLKQQKFIVSQFWRLDIRHQGVGRAALPLEPVGEHFSCLSQLLVVFWQSLVLPGL